MRLTWRTSLSPLLLSFSCAAMAGGGPETTLIVINAASPLSRTIANHYVRLRDIPDSHVVWLDDVPASDSITLEAYRSRIWQPIRAHLRQYRLEEEIDAIAYSADFPYRADFSADLAARKESRLKYTGTHASLTGLTYFARGIEGGQINYLGVNQYFRRSQPTQHTASRAPTREEAALIEEGRRALEQRDFPRAVQLLQAFVAKYSHSAHGWYHLARALSGAGQLAESLQALTRAVEQGWPHSLSARTDAHLKALQETPEFFRLIERMQRNSGAFQPAHGFRNQYLWTGADTPATERVPANHPNRYYLSMFLAYTGLRGNSLPEILAYLRSAAGSDGSAPDGTVYLLENPDIRAQTRERYFHATLTALQERGHKVEILSPGRDGQNGVVPVNRHDIIGAVIGSSRYKWNRSNSTILPGAIVESLTSYGGDFNKSFQTKLTAVLRAGAAGSSGAVAEPYSIQAKFPTSALHVHYADGSSLAEAFYQSVETPYQLIIVGDPLARPFARFAEVRLDGPDAAAPWNGVAVIRPQAVAADGRAIRQFELWVDGQLLDSIDPHDALLWDTRGVEDGCHDLRIVTVEDSTIETRSAVRTQVSVSNRGHALSIESTRREYMLGDAISLHGEAAGATQVQVFQGVRQLATVRVVNGSWQADIASRALGLGPLALFARAVYSDGAAARSCPLTLEIGLPPALAALAVNETDRKPGLRVQTRDATGANHSDVIEELAGELGLSGVTGVNVRSLTVEGEFNVEVSGLQQLAIATAGGLRVEVDGVQIFNGQLGKDDRQALVPLHFEAGWHRLVIELKPAGSPRITARIVGEQPAQLLAGKLIRH